MKDNMLEIREVAALLHCSSSTARRLIDRGIIRGVRLSETAPRRVHRNDLQRYADGLGVALDWGLVQNESGK